MSDEEEVELDPKEWGRRNFRRVASLLKAKFVSTGGTTYAGTVTEVSMGGLRLAIDAADVGEIEADKGTIEVEFPDESWSSEADVARIDKSEASISVEFADTGTRFSSALYRFVSSELEK